MPYAYRVINDIHMHIHKRTKYALLLGVLAIALIVGVSTWLDAAPSIGPVAATPTHVVINTATDVLFTAQITDPSVISTGVNLVQVDAAGKTIRIVGTMRDDGTGGDALAADKTFTLSVPLIQNTAGVMTFQVSAAFKGLLRRILSDPIEVVVSPPAVMSQLGVTVTFPPNLSVSNPHPELSESVYFTDTMAPSVIGGREGTFGCSIEYSAYANDDRQSLEHWLEDNVGDAGTDVVFVIQGRRAIKRAVTDNISGEPGEIVVIDGPELIIFLSATGTSCVATMESIATSLTF